jgi:L-amino acid N-acyltransferase YncA
MQIIKIKKTNESHAKFLYDLRNEKYSRKNSFIKTPITWSEHNHWLKSTLKNKKNIFYVFNIRKSNVGFVRLENIYDNTYEVSIACKKKYHNKGIGKFILSKCEKKIKLNAMLFAKVQTKNRASVKMFNSLDYSILNQNSKYKLFYKVIIMENKNNIKNVIKNIEQNRKKNNLNWMDLLNLSFKNNPYQTRKIFKKIYNSDKTINNLSKKLL